MRELKLEELNTKLVDVYTCITDVHISPNTDLFNSVFYAFTITDPNGESRIYTPQATNTEHIIALVKDSINITNFKHLFKLANKSIGMNYTLDITHNHSINSINNDGLSLIYVKFPEAETDEDVPYRLDYKLTPGNNHVLYCAMNDNLTGSMIQTEIIDLLSSMLSCGNVSPIKNSKLAIIIGLLSKELESEIFENLVFGEIDDNTITCAFGDDDGYVCIDEFVTHVELALAIERLYHLIQFGGFNADVNNNYELFEISSDIIEIGKFGSYDNWIKFNPHCDHAPFLYRYEGWSRTHMIRPNVKSQRKISAKRCGYNSKIADFIDNVIESAYKTVSQK